MKIIDGTNAVLGRLASYCAKQALRGEEVVVVNCENILITGRKKAIEKDFEKRRKRVGSSQKGPKISRGSERIVKRTIRGMLPNHRRGRGRTAYKKIKCYKGVPKKFLDKEKLASGKEKHSKFIYIKEIFKQK